MLLLHAVSCREATSSIATSSATVFPRLKNWLPQFFILSKMKCQTGRLDLAEQNSCQYHQGPLAPGSPMHDTQFQTDSASLRQSWSSLKYQSPSLDLSGFPIRPTIIRLTNCFICFFFCSGTKVKKDGFEPAEEPSAGAQTS